MEKTHYNITVKGKVQGVWFRKYTKEEAAKLKLNGFVKNKTNGDVYTEVEGLKTDIIDFIKWLYLGSPKSKVEIVFYELGEIENFNEFIVKS